jgi:hypothetical protein
LLFKTGFGLSLKSEVLTFFFGMLLILVTFGDSRFHIGTVGTNIGNLDSILGQRLWPVLDVVFPLATIAVFLLYGWSKQERLRIDLQTAFLFLSFLAALTLIIVDDIADVARLTVHLPQLYWSIVSLVFPIYSALSFFLFGKANEKKLGEA